MAGKRCFLTLISMVVAVQMAIAGQSQNKPGEQDQAIRLKSELIEMRVVVTDRKGQLVDNLKQVDFDVTADGKPQAISFFSVERIKGRTVGVAPRPEKPSVPRAPTAQPASQPARVIVLFVDNIHLPAFSFMRIKEQLKRFLDEQLTDQDLVALVPTYGTLGVLQQFMRDRKMLKHAIDKITPFNRDNSLFTPYLAARITSEDEQAISVGLQILAAEEAYQPLSAESARTYVQGRAMQVIARETSLRKATLGTLRAVCERMAEMPGQRIVVMMSDGFTMLDQGGGEDNSSLRAVTGRAARSGVVIYSLEAKGLNVSPGFNAANPVISSNYLAQSEINQQSTLKTIAHETGGEAYVNHNDLAIPFQKILGNNSIYYVIAYYGTDEKESKKYRNVTIKVKGRPEYSVRAPKGYMPPDAEKTEVAMTPRQKLLQAMLSPLPATGIAVSPWADYLESLADDAQVTMQLSFDANPIRHQQQEQKYQFECEIMVAVFDTSGSLAESFADTVKATLNAGQVEQAKQNGYRYTKRLRLKPGLYQLRAGVRDSGSEIMGTSMVWVEVPDLSKGKLALSSIFLAREPAANEKTQRNVVANEGNPGPKLIDGKAVFKSGDVAAYRLVAYNTAAETAGKQAVMMKIDIIQNEKPVFEGAWRDIASRLIRSDSKGAELGGRIPLGLPPGVYEMRVSVKEAKSKKPSQQTVTFEIEP